MFSLVKNSVFFLWDLILSQTLNDHCPHYVHSKFYRLECDVINVISFWWITLTTNNLLKPTKFECIYAILNNQYHFFEHSNLRVGFSIIDPKFEHCAIQITWQCLTKPNFRPFLAWNQLHLKQLYVIPQGDCLNLQQTIQ